MLIIFHAFKTGDFVEAGGVSGIVESMSIFTTIMRTGDNREVIVPNGQIYSSTITNYPLAIHVASISSLTLAMTMT